MNKEEKRFIIHVTTNWCGMDQEYPAIAESESALWDLAEELAYANFTDFGLWEDIAEEHGYDTSEMSNLDWEILQSDVDESEYYSSYIEEFTGDEQEWNDLVHDAGQVYKPNV